VNFDQSLSVKPMFKSVIQFRSFFHLQCCHFLFLEKKKVTKENSRKERNSLPPFAGQAVPFDVPGLSFIATVASTFVFHACIPENLRCRWLGVKEQLSFTTVAQS